MLVKKKFYSNIRNVKVYDFSGGNSFRISDISDMKMKIAGRYSFGTGNTTQCFIRLFQVYHAS